MNALGGKVNEIFIHFVKISERSRRTNRRLISIPILTLRYQ